MTPLDVPAAVRDAKGRFVGFHGETRLWFCSCGECWAEPNENYPMPWTGILHFERLGHTELVSVQDVEAAFPWTRERVVEYQGRLL